MLLIGVSHAVQVIKSAKGVQGSALAALQSVFEHQRSSSMVQSQLVCGDVYSWLVSLRAVWIVYHVQVMPSTK